MWSQSWTTPFRTRHFVSEYRCLQRQELTSALTDAGFTNIEWQMPAQSGFYQPIVMACLLA
jgi:hypothetical protein